MRIVDAHHHLWDLDALAYPWLTDQVREVAYGDYAAIRRSYLPQHFETDIGDLPVVKSVHVQAECDAADPVAETRWLESVADRSPRGFPNAIVAFVDLSAPDARKILRQHAAYSNVRGVRQMLHAGPARAYLTNHAWKNNLARLADHAMSFDMQIQPRQAADAARVIEEHPAVPFVLDHAGCPVRDGPGWQERWDEGLQRLADLPNVSIKLSGFGMFERAWTTASIEPLVDRVIELFGAERCLFASNFPVDSLMAPYQRIWSSFIELAERLPIEDRDRMMYANADRFYRL